MAGVVAGVVFTAAAAAILAGGAAWANYSLLVLRRSLVAIEAALDAQAQLARTERSRLRLDDLRSHWVELWSAVTAGGWASAWALVNVSMLRMEAAALRKSVRAMLDDR